MKCRILCNDVNRRWCDAKTGLMVALACILISAASSPVRAQGIQGLDFIGPMIGRVAESEATIWTYPGPGTTMWVAIWPVGDPAARQIAPFSPDPGRNYVASITIDGLAPDTQYNYQVAPQGALPDHRGGTFRTAPPAGVPTEFTMTFASCMDIRDQDQSSWNYVGLVDPSFQLLVGDAVYSNTSNHDIIWDHHMNYRQVPEFAQVIANTPTYAIWDDHDYGPNDSDGTLPGKENSLRAFLEVWENPEAVGAPVPGAFFEFSWADVDFFVLDGRYHRSPNSAPNNDSKRMLGDAQFAWFEERLLASTATFKVIVSGSTLQISPSDGWSLYDFSRERLYRTIMDNRIEGVIYLSGDLHFSLIDEHPKEETGGYTLYEIISSGITRGDGRSFVALTFDTSLPDPTVRVRIITGTQRRVREDRTLYLSDMRVE